MAKIKALFLVGLIALCGNIACTNAPHDCTYYATQASCYPAIDPLSGNSCIWSTGSGGCVAYSGPCSSQTVEACAAATDPVTTNSCMLDVAGTSCVAPGCAVSSCATYVESSDICLANVVGPTVACDSTPASSTSTVTCVNNGSGMNACALYGDQASCVAAPNFCTWNDFPDKRLN